MAGLTLVTYRQRAVAKAVVLGLLSGVVALHGADGLLIGSRRRARSWALARLAAAIALPAALLFRARYRAYAGARVFLGAAIVLSLLPTAAHAVMALFVPASLATVGAVAVLAILAGSLAGFMGAETTGAGTYLAPAAVVLLAADLALAGLALHRAVQDGGPSKGPPTPSSASPPDRSPSASPRRSPRWASSRSLPGASPPTPGASTSTPARASPGPQRDDSATRPRTGPPATRPRGTRPRWGRPQTPGHDGGVPKPPPTMGVPPKTPGPIASGTVLALISALLFGVSTPAVQHLGRAQGPFTTAALLYAGAAAISALTAKRRGEAKLGREARASAS